jgi:nucleotide sugar dehydrogenase
MKRDIGPLLVRPQLSIKDTMNVINEGARLKIAVGIALVVDKKKRLIGIVTDGDIRNALVKGTELNDPVEKIMTREPIIVDHNLSVDDMIATVMQKVRESGRFADFKVDKVVAVDNGRRVVDVFNFYDLWYRRETRYKKICIVGTGYIGLTLGVIMAESDYEVTGFDTKKKLIDNLKQGKVGFYEKGLKPLLNLHLKNGNIRFITALSKPEANVYAICVGTPINKSTNMPILSSIKRAASNIAKVLKKDDLILLRSTVPVGTTRNVVLPILEKVSALKAGNDFYLAFVPERAIEGNALEEIKEIPQIIGGLNKKSVDATMRVFGSVSSSMIIMDTIEATETVKLVNNTFRDYSFAFANKIALMCDKMGLDAVKVIKSANEGYPRNKLPLPSPGVGGYCLHKDSHLMAQVAKEIGLDADVFINSRKINSAMPHFVSDKVLSFINKNWPLEKRLKIFIMGFAFKGYPETSDIRNSPTIDLLDILKDKLKNRAAIYGYDPVVKKEGIKKLGVRYADQKSGFKNAHCVLLMNNNPEFAKIDVFTLLEHMKKPGLFFDGWHFFIEQGIEKIDGITYQGLGGGF